MSESSSCSRRVSSSSSAYAARPSRACLHPPTLLCICDPDSPASLPSLMQFSIHRSPVTLQKEVAAVCPSLRSQPAAAELLLVPTFQRVKTPLTEVTAVTEAEKNRLLENVRPRAAAAAAACGASSSSPAHLCLLLQGRGYFADYIDPCTGHPALHARSSCVYSEVEAASQLLRYRVEQAGCCSIVLHPAWGSACYPATIVTTARIDALLREMEAVKRRWEVKGEGEYGRQGDCQSAGRQRWAAQEERKERETDDADGGGQQQQPDGVGKIEEELKQLDDPQLLGAEQQQLWTVRDGGRRSVGSEAAASQPPGRRG